MIVAFTGHRPDKMNHRVNEVCVAIEEALVRLAPSMVISGMARGVDMLAAATARKLGIPYTAAVPFLSQISNHDPKDVAAWETLIRDASDVKVVCEGDYAVWKFQKRNEWMVDNCDLLLTVWDGSRGGTRNCIVYAERVGRQIEHLKWL